MSEKIKVFISKLERSKFNIFANRLRHSGMSPAESSSGVFQKNKHFQKKHFIMIAVAVLFISVSVSVPVHQAQAGLVDIGADFLAKGLLYFLDSGPIQVLIKFLLAVVFIVLNLGLDLSIILVRFGAWLIDVMLDPRLYVGDTSVSPNIPGVLTSSTITVGWTTVRDMCNTFYVFFLLIIAFGTILRSSTYNAKNLLPKLIISLFLINFSAEITKLVIDFGQVFMYGIMAWMGTFQDGGGTLTSIVAKFKNEVNIPGLQASLDQVIRVAFALAYSVVLGLTYVMLALFLLVRLVAFVFLIILSPIAFLSIVLPSMGKYTSEWWGELVKYSIFGPIFMFFVYLSATMANELVTNFTPLAATGDLDKITGIVYVMVPHAVALMMLLAVVPVTQRLGVAGAGKIIGGTAGFGKIVMGGYAGAKLAGGLGKKAGGAVANRSERVRGIVEGSKDKYSSALSKMGLHKQKSKFDTSREAAKAKNLKDAQIDIIGEIDIKNADTKTLKKAADSKLENNSASAVYLKHLAATNQLGTLDTGEKQKYLDKAKPYLDKKEQEDLAHKDLEMASMTDKGQKRIKEINESSVKGYDTLSADGQNRMANGGTVDEEYRREVLAEIIKEKKLNDIGDLENELTTKIVVDVVGAKELGQMIDSMDEKKKEGFQGALLKNAIDAETVGDTKNANKFRSEAFNAGRHLTGTGGAFEGKENQIEDSYSKFNAKRIIKMTDQELNDHAYNTNSSQSRIINREGRQDIVVKINDSKNREIRSFGPAPHNPTDQRRIDRLTKERNSNQSFIDGTQY